MDLGIYTGVMVSIMSIENSSFKSSTYCFQQAGMAVLSSLKQLLYIQVFVIVQISSVSANVSLANFYTDCKVLLTLIVSVENVCVCVENKTPLLVMS